MLMAFFFFLAHKGGFLPLSARSYSISVLSDEKIDMKCGLEHRDRSLYAAGSFFFCVSSRIRL